MKYKIIVLEPVADELAEAAIYYDSKQSGLGVDLIDEWDKALSHIQRAPDGYQKKRKNFRQALLDRFPYLVIFEIDNFDIIITRFINAQMHPKKRYKKSKK